MQIVGKCIFGTYPEPTRYYAELRAVPVGGDPTEFVGPDCAVLCTVPCYGPGEAIADGREAARLTQY